jgi:hypothetical protein
VYQVENVAEVFSAHRTAAPTPRAWVNRTVLALGLTSLFTDVSAEMVTAVLPLYLVFGLHQSPLVFGAVDGLYTGATAPVRLLGGLAADRARRHRQVAVAGYGLSTLARLGMVLVGNVWGALAGLVLVDRLGKGIRTSPRDAMISMATPRAQWGAAFGVHRMLDMAGAMLRVPRTRAVLVAATLLGLATLGDAFVYLALQDRLGFDVGLFPLLPVATSLVFMLAAVPIGRLADRAGRGRVFVAGYVALLIVYGILLGPAGAVSAVAALLFLGVYYAATDGVLMALAGESVPVALRGTGLAMVATATSLSRLASSLLFGLVWTVAGVHEALMGFAVGLLAALVVAVILIGRVGRKSVDDHDAA